MLAIKKKKDILRHVPTCSIKGVLVIGIAVGPWSIPEPMPPCTKYTVNAD